MIAIINAELVMRDHLIPEAVLFIEDGKIAGFGEMRTTEIPAGCQIIDAEGAYVGPGLVDIHCHAGHGKRFEHDPKLAASYHLPHGTTSMLATLGGRLEGPKLVEGINGIRAAMETPEGRNIAGIYMEGPYINPDFGSLAHENPWRFGAHAKDYNPILEAGKELIRVWSVGPETEGIEQFVKDAKATCPNIRFAVGHSQASPQQIEKLVPYGLCIGTHHINATGDLPKYPECRGVCVDECVNYNDAIYAEVISDSMGIHVDPYMQRLIRKIKGDDKIILISDHTAYQSDPIPGLEHVTDLNFTPMENGGIDISGSKLTLNVASRNWMKHTGASIVDAFRVGSYTPAKVVGLHDRGEILEGLRADLVIVDYKMNVKKVILKGEVVG